MMMEIISLPGQQFAICIRNDNYPASLEVRKIYQVLPDKTVEPEFIRVIDESGEDYLYPASFFESVSLPTKLAAKIAKAA